MGEVAFVEVIIPCEDDFTCAEPGGGHVLRDHK